ncbi:MAG: crossover junction endodeoxyribonuclease RuvC [Candidatus Pacebacteria bacterium]|nr:crossover junction endodeoxyribonuclease RuvC [Candidatus Paceibacterota bacterium]NUQ56915.1 crossover junction endodeoxyribonuclease RuvC [Candidatus Paceibacter sp.]
MLILGIDPGFERMGFAVLDKSGPKEKLVYSCCIVTKRSDPHEKRLLHIRQNLNKTISEFRPKVMAIESLFFAGNQKTAIKVAEARGVALCAAAENNLRVMELTPLEVKMALTGYGRAEKEQVRKMIAAILKLEKPAKYDDEMDAIAIALAASPRQIQADK